ncbi:Protein DML1 [Spathaspora sp. JA1]|nr:Protein DML1 [Spathaspora sp. JA1]
MGEIITVSLSQFSGHVTTHLYNAQEALIPYKPNIKLTHDLSTFLLRTPPGSGGVTYTPRALIYDLRGGFGALNKYEYHETITSLTSHVQINSNPIPKSEYQIKLDSGEPLTKLTTNNTKYWSDYNRLIYSPKSLHSISSYEYDTKQGHHYRYPRMSFDTFDKGVEDFKESFEDDEFRHFLEKCDLFTGLQVFTDLESGWAGYTSQWLTEITDEYFNKVDVWTFAQTSTADNNTKAGVSLNRIKGVVELYKSSSLLFPMLEHVESPLVQYDQESLWHRSALHSTFINSLWGLLNQVENRETMSSIQGALTGRKIVNEIKLIATDSTNNGGAETAISDVIDINAYYSNPPQANTHTDTTVFLGIQQNNSDKYFSNNRIVTKDYIEDMQEKPTPNIYINDNISNILKQDSFPDDILAFTKFHTEFNIHPGLHEQLKGYRQIVSRTNHPELIKIIEDRGELVEDISSLMEEYRWGEYDSDDDEFYD